MSEMLFMTAHSSQAVIESIEILGDYLINTNGLNTQSL